MPSYSPQLGSSKPQLEITVRSLGLHKDTHPMRGRQWSEPVTGGSEAEAESGHSPLGLGQFAEGQT